LCSRSSSCLTRQPAINQSLNLVLNLAIVRARALTSSASLAASTSIRLAQRHGRSSERTSRFRIGYRSRNRCGRRIVHRRRR
jgi:hypothetical protein